MAADVASCCGPVNRGLAVLGDTLYLGTFDCHLVALDLVTGKERWDVVVADYKVGHSMTAAPLAVKDKIIVGISGGEFGIRGFLDAYDPATGARAWRFWTIPGPSEPGHETWGPGEAWRHGGAPTWVTGSFDPELNLLYWGTGNPGPDYNGDDRPGDNLYTCSVLALDPDTGRLRWHFQYTPHDLHDWDSNQTPVLFEATIAGQSRKLLAQANRNGFYYVLDRVTGEFVAGAPYIKITWATGLDDKGKPILVPGMEPTPEGVLVYPGLTGATNWYAPAFNPATRLVYVQALVDYAQTFYKLKHDFEPGENFESGGTRNVLGQESYATIKALEATTGKLRWEFKLATSANCGVMSTAGGLVFGGSREGNFYALDAATGAPLWHFQTGGAINANPISYLVDGKQQIAIAAGSGIFVFTR
jgi:alcohol dehydrogenase (cytochrome c)